MELESLVKIHTVVILWITIMYGSIFSEGQVKDLEYLHFLQILKMIFVGRSGDALIFISNLPHEEREDCVNLLKVALSLYQDGR